MTNKSKARHGIRRTNKFTLNPTTRAIRNAFALGLVLAGSGNALAGVCAVSAPDTVSCNGDFTDTIPGAIFAPAVDLTLVLGDSLPTSVIAAIGNAGIDATWAGNIAIVNYADISSDGADGIHAYSELAASLSNHGNIETLVSAAGANAVHVRALGDVTISNSGDIQAHGTDVFDVTAVIAASLDGNASVDNLGSILATSVRSQAIGVLVQSNYGTATASNSGSIETVGGEWAYGVLALGGAGATVENSGVISADSTGDVIGSMYVFGISANTHDGDATIVNSGSVIASASGSTVNGPYGSGLYANMVAIGLDASSEHGNVNVENSGSVYVHTPGDAPYGSTAIGLHLFSAYGDITVNNTETGSITVVQPYGYASGMNIYAPLGGADITNAGTITVDSDYGVAAGIAVLAKYADPVSIVNSGDLTMTGYANSIGIVARNGTGTMTVDNSGNISVDSSNNGSATGINTTTKYGATNVTNSGDISVTNVQDDFYANGTGIAVLTVYGGDIDIGNTGGVSVSAYNASGIIANAKYGNVEISNGVDGTISVDGAMAAGIDASAKYAGNVVIDNDGSVVANGRYQAVGIYANTMYGPYGFSTGSIAIDNSGDITANSSNFLAFGVFAQGYYGTSVTNSGHITANGVYANGVVASEVFGDAIITNEATGVIIANATDGEATAAMALNIYGASTIVNDGAITAISEGNRAVGAAASTQYGVAEVVNSATGTIQASGYNSAAGVLAYGGQLGRLINHGVIGATAAADEGLVTAYGSISAAGLSVTLNYGSITADASVAGEGVAMAIGALGYGNGVTVVNEGSITAIGDVAEGLAAAVGIYAYGEFNASYNYGSITGSASAGTGYADAFGIQSIGILGSSVFNSVDGTLTASATLANGTATANGVYNYGFYGAYVTNEGSIAASASVSDFGYAIANGVANVGYLVGTVSNSGDITASADVFEGLSSATGIYNLVGIYDAQVTNDGTITATASAVTGYAYATGVANNQVIYYGTSITANTGDISAVASTGWGIAEAIGVTGYAAVGDAILTNTGSIVASATTDRAYAFATGSNLYVGAGHATTTNYGDISGDATAHGDYAYAVAKGALTTGSIFVPTVATLVNHGDISANAVADGHYGFASAMGTGTMGKYVAQTNFGDISSLAVSDSMAFAYGSYASGWKDITDTNHGNISAVAVAGFYANAHGLVDAAYDQGATTTVNNGDISAVAYVPGDYDTGYGGVAYAFGVTSKARNAAYLHNAGSISAEASAAFGLARAVGVSMDSKRYNSELVNDGEISAVASAYHYMAVAIGADLEARFNVSSTNSGSITAYATADFSDISATAVGSSASGWGISSNAILVNHGDIEAVSSAYAGRAYSVGAGSRAAITSTLDNDGSISALSAAAEGLAVARGTYVVSLGRNYGAGNAVLNNTGDISAMSGADNGLGYAYGAVTVSDMHATTNNDGSITAAVNADDGSALAVGSLTLGSYASLVNHGDITSVATTSGTGIAMATGAALSGDVAAYGNGVWYFYAYTHNSDSTVDNSGDIHAVATAGTGIAYATGLSVASQYGSVAITNAGDLTAMATGAAGSTATGIYMGSAGSNTLINTGSINAVGTGSQHIAISSSDLATATIDNHGIIRGSILTGSLDDSLLNHGSASIFLDNDTIDLGSYSALGNLFVNNGDLIVRGAGNGIDMGGNLLAFTNNGTIDFLDGVADDVLHITGDFAGDGVINVDVSGLHNNSDRLYIDGNVVDGSTQTINVALLDMPTTASSAITVVSVAGDASAGDFVLGNVGFAANQSFLGLDFSLRSSIDASNARDDVFALGVEVTGLNDSGVLAASIAPGAQTLMATQVGTWRQRMGVIDQVAKGGVSLWARLFQAKGSITPGHDSDFGQEGNFAFEQKSSGIEAGAHFALSDQFSAGLLLGKAEGRQHLEGAGVGSSTIDGNTYGVYATWIAPAGFYVDGSYRWMDFSADMTSAAGPLKADGDAGTFNLEAGYAWTLQSGLKLEPQLQYTRTEVSNVDAVDSGLTELQVADGTSSTARAGLMLRKSFGASAGGSVWTPYASINAVHEFDGDNGYSINGDFTGNTDIAGTSALLEGGFTFNTGNLSVYGGLNWQDGGAFDGVFGGQLGLRYNW